MKSIKILDATGNLMEVNIDFETDLIDKIKSSPERVKIDKISDFHYQFELIDGTQILFEKSINQLSINMGKWGIQKIYFDLYDEDLLFIQKLIEEKVG